MPVTIIKDCFSCEVVIMVINHYGYTFIQLQQPLILLSIFALQRTFCITVSYCYPIYVLYN